jgi:hypothetical protein
VDPFELVVGRRFGRQSGLRPDVPQQVDARPEPERRQRVLRPEVIGERPRAEDEQGSGGGGHDRMMRCRAVSSAHRSTIAAMQDIALVLVIVLIVVVIWRGPKTLPLLGKAFGQGVKEARREIDDIKADRDDDTTPPAA